MEPVRELAVGASHGGKLVFVASEPEGRTQVSLSVEPSRDCCVNAWGLSDPDKWRNLRNLSGTAGEIHSSQRF